MNVKRARHDDASLPYGYLASGFYLTHTVEDDNEQAVVHYIFLQSLSKGYDVVIKEVMNLNKILNAYHIT